MASKKKLEKSVKRENINGKFFIVARENGHIIAKKRPSKDFNLEKAKRLFRANRTFDKDKERIEVKSKDYFKINQNLPRKIIKRRHLDTIDKPNVPFRVVIMARLKNGDQIIGYSDYARWDSVNEAIDSALEHFFHNVATPSFDVTGETSNANEGREMKDMIIKSSMSYKVEFIPKQ